MFKTKNFTIAEVVTTASRFMRAERGATAIEYAIIARYCRGHCRFGDEPRLQRQRHVHQRIDGPQIRELFARA
ncbi:MAG: hypothetical protein WBD83_14705 [Xanthobacteraceae bacterium]|jgi:hypothetical protein